MLCQSRNVRRHLRAFEFCRAQRHQLAAANMRQGARQHKHTKVNVVAHQVVGQRCHSAIRNVSHEQSRLILEHFPGQMQRSPHARAAVAVLAGIGLNQLDELVDGFDAGLLRGDQHQRLRGNQAQRREVLNVVLDRSRHQAVDRNFIAGAGQQHIAVWDCIDHFLSTYRATCTAHIVDDHRHTELFGQLGGHGASGQVSAAARWIAHHD